MKEAAAVVASPAEGAEAVPDRSGPAGWSAGRTSTPPTPASATPATPPTTAALRRSRARRPGPAPR